MTTKNVNAKKVLMSTIAAVVFSFAFTTSAMAEVSAPTKGNVGIRVKTEQKGNVGIRVKTEQNKFEEFLYQTLGIRVKVRVK